MDVVFRHFWDGQRATPGPKSWPSKRRRIRDLADTYLETQAQLWPELVGSNVLDNTERHRQQYAEQFKSAFLGNHRLADQFPKLPKLDAQVLAACYLRFSSDRSNPRSLAQQLRNCLERAKRENAFIPWSLVFADAAITGTHANRRGYKLAKSIIEADQNTVNLIFIDEIGRASRDAIEALLLGRLVDASSRRLIGASDSFDSTSAHSKMMLHMFAMLHEFYVDQLKQKVDRGMRDAFERGDLVGTPAFGYRLREKTDAEGRLIRTPRGVVKRERVVCEIQAEQVQRMFRLFVQHKVSPDRIAKIFNDEHVAGSNKWGAKRIRDSLRRRTYVGIEYYYKTYRTLDPATGKYKTVKRPKAEWKTREVPQLRIVSDELFAAAERRFKELKRCVATDDKSVNRATAYPALLVRPLCKHCRTPLTKGKSGKYISLCCKNGTGHRLGCQLDTYKSSHIIEKCVLRKVEEAVLTAEFKAELLEKANTHLEELSRQPTVDTSAVKQEIASNKKRLSQLTGVLTEADGELESVLVAIRKLEKKIAELRQTLSELRSAECTGSTVVNRRRH